MQGNVEWAELSAVPEVDEMARQAGMLGQELAGEWDHLDHANRYDRRTFGVAVLRTWYGVRDVYGWLSGAEMHEVSSAFWDAFGED